MNKSSGGRKREMKRSKFIPLVEFGCEDKNGSIRVKCPKCGREKILEDFAAWFYIILRHTICECGGKISAE